MIEWERNTFGSSFAPSFRAGSLWQVIGERRRERMGRSRGVRERGSKHGRKGTRQGRERVGKEGTNERVLERGDEEREV